MAVFRTTLAVLTMGALLLLPSCRAVEEHILSDMLTHYIAAQEALADDNLEEARLSLEELALMTDGEFKALVEKAAAGSDIESLRRRFQTVSNEIVVRELPDGFVVARCPHGVETGEAVWVQKDGRILNPYHGQHAVDCGEVEGGP